MKKSLILLAGLLLFSYLEATTPPNSNWHVNLSEGEGEMETGFHDYYPEVISSMGVVHTLWLTDDPQSNSYDLAYKRSPDNGVTWESKQILRSSAFDYFNTYNRIAVSGNYVHIIVNETGTPDILYYYRSDDAGATFAAVDTLYKTDFDIDHIRVKADGSNVYVSFVWGCHFCGTKQIYYLIKSENNGMTWGDPKALVEDPIGNLNNFGDLKVEGENVYLPYFESVGPWYDYDYNFHILSSQDGGDLFLDNIISVPAADGIHHPFDLQNHFSSYVPKIAADKNNVWVVWSGLDETDQQTVFVRKSTDAGQTWKEAIKINGEHRNLEISQATIAARGKHVYISFLEKNSKAWLVRSIDGGESYYSPEEITNPESADMSGTWEPRIIMDPQNDAAHLISTGFLYSYIPMDLNPFYTQYFGYYDLGYRRPAITIGENGVVHLFGEGDGIWIQTGVFSDRDIIYRRLNPNYNEMGSSNKGIRLNYYKNVGDGSGNAQYDNMRINPSETMSFSDALTIELWVKPDYTGEDQSIITQNHIWTNNIGVPYSFQFWLRESGQPAIGIFTETGSYTLWGSKNLEFGYWNHVAITFDAEGQENNFKVYVNGQVSAETLTSGELKTSNLNWVIGFTKEGVERYGFQGTIDELRFWRTNRSIEQLHTNMYTVLEGNEPGLVAYYNFDTISAEGQVYDLTNNVNTGYGMFKETLENVSINDPKVSFTYTQTINSFQFDAFPKEGNSYHWDFGDGEVSDLANPQYVYETPGNYDICLQVKKDNLVGSYCESVTIEGLDRITPNSGGNKGHVTAYIYGGGLDELSEVYLRRNGFADIEALDVLYNEDKTLTVLFNLIDVELGLWDVVVNSNSSEMILPSSFLVVEGKGYDLSLQWIAGGGNQLINTWTRNILRLKNSGDADAYGVQIWIAVPDTFGIEFEPINLDVEVPEQAAQGGYVDFLTDYMGDYQVLDSVFEPGMPYRMYGYYFPVVPADFDYTIIIRTKTTEGGNNFKIHTWFNPPLYEIDLDRNRGDYNLKLETLICQGSAIVKAALKIGVGLVPGLPCITGAAQIVFDKYQEYEPPTPHATNFGARIPVKSNGWTYSTALFECLTSLVPSWANPANYQRALKVVNFAVQTFTAEAEFNQENEDCKNGWYKVDFWAQPFVILFSFDPNDKSGIAGPGNTNFIRSFDDIPYTIRFENKDSATAPAREVRLADTLDLTSFQPDNFSFGPFGFGDTVLYPIKSLTEFGMDVDLRPKRDLIVRIQGKIDTITGIIEWTFQSLDPATMELTDDILSGFLLPNKNPPEGEGFVTFNAGLKEGLPNLHEVKNTAFIYFDANEAIITNQYINKLDLLPPESEISSEDLVTTDSLIRLPVNGIDGESGIQWYELWVSKNDSAYLYKGNIKKDSFDYKLEPGTTYKMYTVSVDSVGNRETPPENPDFIVEMITSIHQVTPIVKWNLEPNLVRKSAALLINLEKATDINLELYNVEGQFIRTLYKGHLPSGMFRETFHFNLDPGMYFISLNDGTGIYTKKMIVVE